MQNEFFKDDYSNFIYTSRYARFKPDEQRREYLDETVTRYLDFMRDHLKEKHQYDMPSELRTDLYNAITGFQVVPSMRSLMTAGEALRRDNTAGYNCSYLVADDPKAFDEAMFILMCGTGVGFSVERQYISKLPEIPDRLYDSDTVIKVKDSKEGWAKSYRQLISLLYAGEIPKWDTSSVRPAGARLKTFGGRASGPGPLEDLFRFTIGKFRTAAGRKLSSLECHDLFCKIGEIVVVGGVRRSAMISLSNLSDDRMRHAKSGNWWENEGQRALANNSVSFTEKPDVGSYLREWTSLYESKSGERGIFNRMASEKQASKSGRRELGKEWGTNPCSEIILRPYQFCNLSEVVIRAEDTLESLRAKVRLATILGTFQSTLTNFPYLRKIWQKNTEEERLLGVSLTGIMDNAFMAGLGNKDAMIAYDFSGNEDNTLDCVLEELKNVAIDTNAELAATLGIPVSAAITCVN